MWLRRNSERWIQAAYALQLISHLHQEYGKQYGTFDIVLIMYYYVEGRAKITLRKIEVLLHIMPLFHFVVCTVWCLIQPIFFFLQDSSEEDQQPFSPLASPSNSSVTKKVECLESVTDIQERPSPVSVLEPIFAEDVISPASIRSHSGRNMIEVFCLLHIVHLFLTLLCNIFSNAICSPIFRWNIHTTTKNSIRRTWLVGQKSE